MERVFIGITRAEATRKADEWWERQKRVCAKLYGPRWLLVERDQMASLIDGP